MNAGLEMDPAIRQRWVSALRSGRYPQARENLRTTEGFCCYGVLCELAVEDGAIPAPEEPDQGVYRYSGAIALLPHAVKTWASIGFEQMWLARRNDDGWTFDQIADVIEGRIPAESARF